MGLSQRFTLSACRSRCWHRFTNACAAATSDGSPAPKVFRLPKPSFLGLPGWRCDPPRSPGPAGLNLMHAPGAVRPFLLYRVANEKEEMIMRITRLVTILVAAAALGALGQEEAWRDTKAYASSNRVTYRKGARQKLNALSKEITDLKGRRSEATDPQAFDTQLDTLTQQQATAKEQLATMKKATNAKDYDDARKQFDKTMGEMEDGVAQARKQLRG